jgi:formylglycine-generating enzyme required for sulfatase activity
MYNRILFAAFIMAVFSGCSEKKHETAEDAAPAKDALEPAKEFTNTIGMKLVLIPAGEFIMSSPETEKDRSPNEGPQHKVRITKPFYMGTTEVTQAQWKAVMGNNPSEFQGDDLPVETVSRDDCQEYLKKLSANEGKAYRLPTEAEWEYACRAGSTTRFYSGDDDQALYGVGWYNGNSGDKPHPVGQKKPNAWGLYDMHGNLWEWCEDGYGEYPNGDQVDPTGPAQGAECVLRGGSWLNDSGDCRSATRKNPGFRNNTDKIVQDRKERDINFLKTIEDSLLHKKNEAGKDLNKFIEDNNKYVFTTDYDERLRLRVQEVDDLSNTLRSLDAQMAWARPIVDNENLSKAEKIKNFLANDGIGDDPLVQKYSAEITGLTKEIDILKVEFDERWPPLRDLRNRIDTAKELQYEAVMSHLRMQKEKRIVCQDKLNTAEEMLRQEKKTNQEFQPILAEYRRLVVRVEDYEKQLANWRLRIDQAELITEWDQVAAQKFGGALGFRVVVSSSSRDP